MPGLPEASLPIDPSEGPPPAWPSVFSDGSVRRPSSAAFASSGFGVWHPARSRGTQPLSEAE
eukprot:7770804-Alexandrium_andersonii.AAC.1